MNDQDQFGSVEDVQEALGLRRPTEPSAAVESEPTQPAEADPVEHAAEPPAPVAASDTSTHNPDADQWLAPGVPLPRSAAQKREAERAWLEAIHGPREGSE